MQCFGKSDPMPSWKQRHRFPELNRRHLLRIGTAGLPGILGAGLLNAQRAVAADSPVVAKADHCIVLFLNGGPSHLDMWDPKPDAPVEIRGPYQSIPTRLPGVRFSEHLPLQASIADKLSIIRSVDCSASNHTPITMQAGNPLARRTNDGRDGAGYPSMGSIASKFRGPNDADLPSFVGLADSWAADVWEAGHMGTDYSPVKGTELQGKFAIPAGFEADRLRDRNGIRLDLDQFGTTIHNDVALSRTDRYTQQAYELVMSGKVQKAFDVEQESPETREAYGNESIGKKALLARRLVEAGVTFVLVSGAWGYFDHHGDNVRWGGIEKGLTPLLPRVDRTLYTLV
ncbi:MAG: DUF1501 domain-containing protein, partial [Planctomycetaceae bacterium]|nr:DUF1501 domain-containing protein [Planctomycetaceae bacterium]